MCEAPSIPKTRHEWRQFLDSRRHGSRVHDLVLRRLVGYTSPMRHHLIAILIAFAATSASAAEYTARVIGISDGDAVTVLRYGRTQVKIHLQGVDAPETRPRPKMLRRTRPLLTRGLIAAPHLDGTPAGDRRPERGRRIIRVPAGEWVGRHLGRGPRPTRLGAGGLAVSGHSRFPLVLYPALSIGHQTGRGRTRERGASTRVRILKKSRGGCSA